MAEKSIFNQLLIALQQKVLAEIPDSVPIPGIRYVDQDLGQIDIDGARPAISFPALLVDFDVPDYQQKQLKAQWANMVISFRLVFDPFGTTSSIASEEIRLKSLIYYEIENKLYEVLQDWTANLLMSGFKRISATTEKGRKDVLRVREIKFKAIYEDRVLQLLP